MLFNVGCGGKCPIGLDWIKFTIIKCSQDVIGNLRSLEVDSDQSIQGLFRLSKRLCGLDGWIYGMGLVITGRR